MPQVTYTDPEVATVGLTEEAARRTQIAYEVSRFELSELDRAIVAGDTRGFVRVLTIPGRDTILGVTIVGAQAGELLAPFVLAMKHRLGLRKILATTFAYPTLSEAGKSVAGSWARAHAPQRLLGWAERFFSWRR
jgi:pyruvate/2-oxoglutarate dehydrogenase complex dihydrolipoamide dehydrogenase (E3) component